MCYSMTYKFKFGTCARLRTCTRLAKRITNTTKAKIKSTVPAFLKRLHDYMATKSFNSLRSTQLWGYSTTSLEFSFQCKCITLPFKRLKYFLFAAGIWYIP